MPEKYTILINPIAAHGHFNACCGIAGKLRDSGHRVVFAVPDNWKNKLSPQGFEEEWLNPNTEADDGNNPSKLIIWNEIVSKIAPSFRLPPEQQIKTIWMMFCTELVRQVMENDPKLMRIIQKVTPDVIIVDTLIHQPAIMDCGIPWVLLSSISPSGIYGYSENLPPAFSGYSTLHKNTKLWESYHQTHKSECASLYKDLKDWVKENGGPDLGEFDPPLLLKPSPYGNIYMGPEELDYTEFCSPPPNFHRFDALVRDSNLTFSVPEKLKNLSGKLIYFSMGTIGCAELGMMRRLIRFLAKSPHRFIVSKGPLADQIELADNMWGEATVPQTKVLPLVDLVISHGGNNTVTESFYFGKPMIILPLFADQPDNAQRLMDTGLGIRLHSHHVQENELLSAIDNIINDEGLKGKMAKISERIQKSNGETAAAELILDIARNN